MKSLVGLGIDHTKLLISTESPLTPLADSLLLCQMNGGLSRGMHPLQFSAMIVWFGKCSTNGGTVMLLCCCTHGSKEKVMEKVDGPLGRNHLQRLSVFPQQHFLYRQTFTKSISRAWCFSKSTTCCLAAVWSSISKYSRKSWRYTSPFISFCDDIRSSKQ